MSREDNFGGDWGGFGDKDPFTEGEFGDSAFGEDPFASGDPFTNYNGDDEEDVFGGMSGGDSWGATKPTQDVWGSTQQNNTQKQGNQKRNQVNQMNNAMNNQGNQMSNQLGGQMNNQGTQMSNQLGGQMNNQGTQMNNPVNPMGNQGNPMGNQGNPMGNQGNPMNNPVNPIGNQGNPMNNQGLPMGGQSSQRSQPQESYKQDSMEFDPLDVRDEEPTDALYVNGKKPKYKIICLGVVLGLLLLLGVFVLIRGVNIEKKDTVVEEQTQTEVNHYENLSQEQLGEITPEEEDNGFVMGKEESTDIQQETVQSQPQEEVQSQPQPEMGNSSEESGEVRNLIVVPDTIELNEEAQLMTAQGQITGKDKLVYAENIIYQLKIGVNIGGEVKELTYFSGANVYNSLSEGESVTVDYKEVATGYYGVQTLKK